MKIKIIFKSLATLALITLPVVGSGILIACSTTHQQESTGQYIDSSVITAKVKTRLLADKYVKSLPITVKTYKNIVQLSGFVDSVEQRRRAVYIARSTEGVAEVQDFLVIKPH